MSKTKKSQNVLTKEKGGLRTLMAEPGEMDLNPHELENEVNKTEQKSEFPQEDKIFKKILRDVGTNIFASRKWWIGGAQRDGDLNRMKEDWKNGEKQADEQLAPPKEIGEILEGLVDCQASLFWMFRGAKKDNDRERQDNDYFDAKRHMGFLIAEKIIENCLKNEKDKTNCFEFLNADYMEYLASISIEEFIRTKAYLLWGAKKNWEPTTDQSEIDEYYYKVQNVIEEPGKKCCQKKPGEISKKFHKDVKEYFRSLDDEAIARIKSGKIHTDSRLNINHPRDVDEYTELFYREVKHAIQKQKLPKEKAQKILKLMYTNTDIPNMLEHFLRCYVCSFIKEEQHNKLRKDLNKSPIPNKKIEPLVKELFP
jgi:hypothetical protein